MYTLRMKSFIIVLFFYYSTLSSPYIHIREPLSTKSRSSAPPPADVFLFLLFLLQTLLVVAKSSLKSGGFLLKCLFVFLFSVKNHPPKIPLTRRMKRDESLLAPNESHKFKRHNLAQNSWWRRRTKKRKKFRSFFFKQQHFIIARFFSLSLSLSCVAVVV